MEDRRSLSVEVAEDVQERVGQAARLGHGERTPVDARSQRLAGDQLEGQVQPQPHALALPEPPHVGGNAGVVQGPQRVCLPLEGVELLHRGNGGELQLLERHPLSPVVVGDVDPGVRPLGEDPLHRVAAGPLRHTTVRTAGHAEGVSAADAPHVVGGRGERCRLLHGGVPEA